MLLPNWWSPGEIPELGLGWFPVHLRQPYRTVIGYSRRSATLPLFLLRTVVLCNFNIFRAFRSRWFIALQLLRLVKCNALDASLLDYCDSVP